VLERQVLFLCERKLNDDFIELIGWLNGWLAGIFKRLHAIQMSSRFFILNGKKRSLKNTQ